METGFIDLQVNGYAGIDFSAPGLRVGDVHEVTRRLLAAGTAAYCPTLITAPEAIYRENLPVVAEAMRDPVWGGYLLGIHLEGPCLLPEAAGAHPRECLRHPDVEDFRRWNAWAEGRIVLHTLAPELPGALPYIGQLSAGGVVVCTGHHLADAETLSAAFRAGARSCTHLGNGLPLTLHRHDNPLLLQLAEPGLRTMFIPDGHHLPRHVVRLIAATRPVEHCIAVSDMSPLAGCPPGDYTLWGSRVRKEPGGRIVNPVTGSLAGSGQTLLECMNRLAAWKLFDPATLLALGRDHALALLGKTRADLPERLPCLRWNDPVFEVLPF